MLLSTSTKIALARVAGRTLLIGRRMIGLDWRAEAVRQGVRFRLDLREGIDLALYLGAYQALPEKVLGTALQPGAVAIDIGANIGAHALRMAAVVGDAGWVVAIEPTRFAMTKLKDNLAANPGLEKRMVLVQAALAESDGEAEVRGFYSRWPLLSVAGDRHGRHLGLMEDASEARMQSLDSLVEGLMAEGSIPRRVDFVKIDVDGNERSVLKGAARTLRTYRPMLLVEMAPYIQDEVPGRLQEVLELLASYGYRFEDEKTGQPMPMTADHYRRMLPDGSGVDLIARCTALDAS